MYRNAITVNCDAINCQKHEIEKRIVWLTMIVNFERLTFQFGQANEDFLFEILELFDARLDGNGLWAIGAEDAHFENARHLRLRSYTHRLFKHFLMWNTHAERMGCLRECSMTMNKMHCFFFLAKLEISVL